MASKHAFRIVGNRSENFERPSGAVTMLTEVWRRERRQQLTRQLAINADVRKRWIEADPVVIGRNEW